MEHKFFVGFATSLRIKWHKLISSNLYSTSSEVSFFVIFLFLEVFDAGQLWTGGESAPHVLGMHSHEEKLRGFIQFPSYASIVTHKAVPMTGTKFPLRDRRYKEKRIKLLNSGGWNVILLAATSKFSKVAVWFAAGHAKDSGLATETQKMAIWWLLFPVSPVNSV